MAFNNTTCKKRSQSVNSSCICVWTCRRANETNQFDEWLMMMFSREETKHHCQIKSQRNSALWTNNLQATFIPWLLDSFCSIWFMLYHSIHKFTVEAFLQKLSSKSPVVTTASVVHHSSTLWLMPTKLSEYHYMHVLRFHCLLTD